MLRTGWWLAVAVALCLAAPAFADGMFIPGPPGAALPDEPYFTIKYHHVKCEINEQVCTTYVDQAFVNEGTGEMEATYLFPLPPGAVVQKFTLHADGKELPARLLNKDEAQGIYEDIVRRRRDPAILTYAGSGAYQARIFPIPPGGQRRVELRYTEVLSYDSGLVSYRYPLSPERLSARPIESVTFAAEIQSKDPIGAVYSPTHDLAVNRLSDRHVRASYEASNTLPDTDVVLHYGVTRDPVGMSIVTFKEPGHDGFFLLLASPAVEENLGDAVPKNICFVLDTSGSMSGEKIQQAQDALTFCVNSLNPQDRFNVVAFSDGVREFADELVPAQEEQIVKARKFINDFTSEGGTDIDSALRTAAKYRVPGQVNYICFLTDGQPTVGEQDPEAIIKNVAAELGPAEQTRTRIFVFGVGYDVNTNFLDELAQGNGGLTTYVRPSESIEVKVSSFFGKIAQPMLTDVEVSYGAAEAYDVFPKEVPDLFHGSDIQMFGRYRADSAGPTTIKLSGTTDRGSKAFELACELPKVQLGTDYVAALWAARKIGYLLDQIRLHGESKQLVDEVVRLGMEYGVLTEYTAFLAEEGRALTADEAATRAADNMRSGFGVAVGAGATSRAQNAQNMQMQAQVGLTNMYYDADGNVQRVANIRNVGQRAFVQRGTRWEDTRYQANQKVALRVKAYSEAHFQLSRNLPALNSQLALGDNILVMLNGQVIEIGPDGKTRLTDEELKALERGEPLEAHAPVAGVQTLLSALLLVSLCGMTVAARRTRPAR